MRHEYFLMETRDGERFRVVLSVDMKGIARRLGGKAKQSRRGVSTAVHGLIKCEVVAPAVAAALDGGRNG